MQGQPAEADAAGAGNARQTELLRPSSQIQPSGDPEAGRGDFMFDTRRHSIQQDTLSPKPCHPPGKCRHAQFPLGMSPDTETLNPPSAPASSASPIQSRLPISSQSPSALASLRGSGSKRFTEVAPIAAFHSSLQSKPSNNSPLNQRRLEESPSPTPSSTVSVTASPTRTPTPTQTSTPTPSNSNLPPVAAFTPFPSASSAAQALLRPSLLGNTATLSLNESVFVGLPLVRVRAFDQYSGSPSLDCAQAPATATKCSINSSDASRFPLSTSSGFFDVSLGLPLDYESAQSHTAQISAKDSSGSSSDLTVEINVMNEDDETPNSKAISIDVPEDAPVSMLLDLAPHATDPDSPGEPGCGTIWPCTYSLLPGSISPSSESGFFELRGPPGGNTNELWLLSPSLSAEYVPVLQMLVAIRDSQNREGILNITVQVQNGDEPPFIVPVDALPVQSSACGAGTSVTGILLVEPDSADLDGYHLEVQRLVRFSGFVNQSTEVISPQNRLPLRVRNSTVPAALARRSQTDFAGIAPATVLECSGQDMPHGLYEVILAATLGTDVFTKAVFVLVAEANVPPAPPSPETPCVVPAQWAPGHALCNLTSSDANEWQSISVVLPDEDGSRFYVTPLCQPWSRGQMQVASGAGLDLSSLPGACEGGRVMGGTLFMRSKAVLQSATATCSIAHGSVLLDIQLTAQSVDSGTTLLSGGLQPQAYQVHQPTTEGRGMSTVSIVPIRVGTRSSNISLQSFEQPPPGIAALGNSVLVVNGQHFPDDIRSDCSRGPRQVVARIVGTETSNATIAECFTLVPNKTLSCVTLPLGPSDASQGSLLAELQFEALHSSLPGIHLALESINVAPPFIFSVRAASSNVSWTQRNTVSDLSGGDEIILRGENFGASLSDVSRVFASLPASPNGTALPVDMDLRACNMIVPQIEIRCAVRAETGFNLGWHVTAHNRVSPAPTTFYKVPSIVDARILDNSTRAVVSGMDTGGERTIIEVTSTVGGGPGDTATLSYGPFTDGDFTRFDATKCTGSKSNTWLCSVAPGWGSGHRLRLTVSGADSSISPEDITISYAEPQIIGPMNAVGQPFLTDPTLYSTQDGASSQLAGTNLGRNTQTTVTFTQNTIPSRTVVFKSQDPAPNVPLLVPQHDSVLLRVPGGNGVGHKVQAIVDRLPGTVSLGAAIGITGKHSSVNFAAPHISRVTIDRGSTLEREIIFKLQGSSFGKCCLKTNEVNTMRCLCSKQGVDATQVHIVTHSSGVVRCNILSIDSGDDTLLFALPKQNDSFYPDIEQLTVSVANQNATLRFKFEDLIDVPVLDSVEVDAEGRCAAGSMPCECAAGILPTAPPPGSTLSPGSNSSMILEGRSFRDSPGVVEQAVFDRCVPGTDNDTSASWVPLQSEILCWKDSKIIVSVPPGQGTLVVRVRIAGTANRVSGNKTIKYRVPDLTAGGNSAVQMNTAVIPTSGFWNPEDGTIGHLHCENDTRSGFVNEASMLQLTGRDFGIPKRYRYGDGLQPAVCAGPTPGKRVICSAGICLLDSTSSFENRVEIGGRECAIVSWNDTRIVCLPPTGAGKDLPITLFIHQRIGKESTVPKTLSSQPVTAADTFSYAAPTISRLERLGPARPYNVPQGVPGWHSRVRGQDLLSIKGASFSNSTFMNGRRRLVVTIAGFELVPGSIVAQDHNEIRILTPPGFGQNHIIRVSLSPDDGYSVQSLFSYDPPVVAVVQLQTLEELQPSSALLRLGRAPELAAGGGNGSTTSAIFRVVGQSTDGVGVATPSALMLAEKNGLRLHSSLLPVSANGATVAILGFNFGESAPTTETIMFGDIPCTAPLGARTVWNSDSRLTCKLQSGTVGVRGLSLSLGATVAQTWVGNSTGVKLACPAGFFGVQPGVDVCEPCPVCGVGECTGEVTTCEGGGTLPEPSPGKFRISLTAPLEASWAHILELPAVRDIARQQQQQQQQVSMERARRLVGFLPPPLNSLASNLTTAEKYIMVQCAPEAACLGDNVCLEGHEGIACQRCSVGFSRSTKGEGLCEPCPTSESSTTTIVLVAIFAAPALLAAKYVAAHAPSTVGIALAVQSLQLLGQMVKLSMPWSSTSEAGASMGAVSQIDLSVSSPSCSVEGWDFISAWYSYQMLPVILTGLFVSIFLGAMAFFSFKKRELVVPIGILTNCLMGWVALLNVMFIGLVSSALEVFSCRDLGGKRVLSADVGIDCFGDRYDGMLAWATVSLYTYGAGIGGLFLLIMIANAERIRTNIRLISAGHVIDAAVKQANEAHMRKEFENLFQPKTQSALERTHLLFGAMYKPFESSYFWWLVVILAHKFALTFAATVFRTQVGVSVALISMELVVFALVGAVFRPYRPGMLLMSFVEAARKGTYGKKMADILKMKMVKVQTKAGSAVVEDARQLLVKFPYLRPTVVKYAPPPADCGTQQVGLAASKPETAHAGSSSLMDDTLDSKRTPVVPEQQPAGVDSSVVLQARRASAVSMLQFANRPKTASRNPRASVLSPAMRRASTAAQQGATTPVSAAVGSASAAHGRSLSTASRAQRTAAARSDVPSIATVTSLKATSDRRNSVASYGRPGRANSDSSADSLGVFDALAGSNGDSDSSEAYVMPAPKSAKNSLRLSVRDNPLLKAARASSPAVDLASRLRASLASASAGQDKQSSGDSTVHKTALRRSVGNPPVASSALPASDPPANVVLSTAPPHGRPSSASASSSSSNGSVDGLFASSGDESAASNDSDSSTGNLFGSEGSSDSDSSDEPATSPGAAPGTPATPKADATSPKRVNVFEAKAREVGTGIKHITATLAAFSSSNPQGGSPMCTSPLRAGRKPSVTTSPEARSRILQALARAKSQQKARSDPQPGSQSTATGAGFAEEGGVMISNPLKSMAPASTEHDNCTDQDAPLKKKRPPPPSLRVAGKQMTPPKPPPGSKRDLLPPPAQGDAPVGRGKVQSAAAADMPQSRAGQRRSSASHIVVHSNPIHSQRGAGTATTTCLSAAGAGGMKAAKPAVQHEYAKAPGVYKLDRRQPTLVVHGDVTVEWATLPKEMVPLPALTLAAYMQEDKEDNTWPTRFLRWLQADTLYKGTVKSDFTHLIVTCGAACMSKLPCRRLQQPSRPRRPGGNSISVSVNPLQRATGVCSSPGSNARRRSIAARVLAPEQDLPDVPAACSLYWETVLKLALRFLLRLSVDYNTLAVVMSLCLFVAVQGSLVSAESEEAGVAKVPLELLAAILLLFLSTLTVAVEVFQAVTYAIWHHAALRLYRSDKVLTQVISRTARSVSVSAQNRVAAVAARAQVHSQKARAAARTGVRRLTLTGQAGASVLARVRRASIGMAGGGGAAAPAASQH